MIRHVMEAGRPARPSGLLTQAVMTDIVGYCDRRGSGRMRGLPAKCQRTRPHISLRGGRPCDAAPECHGSGPAGPNLWPAGRQEAPDAGRDEATNEYHNVRGLRSGRCWPTACSGRGSLLACRGSLGRDASHVTDAGIAGNAVILRPHGRQAARLSPVKTVRFSITADAPPSI